MTNRPRDLFSVCNLLSPGRFGDSFFRFGIRYCAGHEMTVGRGENIKTVWNFDGSSNEEELHRRLSFFMLRRTKTEVAEQLPKETRQVIELSIPRKFLLPTLPSLQSPAAARRALDLAADGALPQVVEMLEEDALEGSKQVVFTVRRAVAEHLYLALQKKGIACGVDPRARSREEERRQDPGGERCNGSPLPHRDDRLLLYRNRSLLRISTVPMSNCRGRLLTFFRARSGSITSRATNLSSIRLLCAKGTAQELQLDILLKKLHLFESIVGTVGDDKLREDFSENQPGKILSRNSAER